MLAVGIRRYLEVTVRFTADYRNSALFVRDIGKLPRLTEFVSINLNRQVPDIDVTMSFRIYQSGPA